MPAYLSIKAIESPSTNDDVQWLTYWVVFGFFNFLESFALRVVLYYLPWYFAFKSIFILWLQLPAFRVRLKAYPRLALLLMIDVTLGRRDSLQRCSQACVCQRQGEDQQWYYQHCLPRVHRPG